MRAAPGSASRIAASTRSIARAMSSVSRSSLKRTSATTRNSSGPRCMVSSSIRSSTASTLADRLLDTRARTCGSTGLAQEQRGVLAPEQERDREQDQPDDDRADRVEGGARR